MSAAEATPKLYPLAFGHRLLEKSALVARAMGSAGFGGGDLGPALSAGGRLSLKAWAVRKSEGNLEECEQRASQ